VGLLLVAGEGVAYPPDPPLEVINVQVGLAFMVVPEKTRITEFCGYAFHLVHDKDEARSFILAKHSGKLP